MTPPYKHWTWLCLMAYLLFQMLTGLVGFVEPSNVLDQLDVVDVYSSLLLVASVLGIIGMFLSPKAVASALIGMAIATLIHGFALVTLGSYQTGIRLLAAPFMMAPMAIVWWKYWTLVEVLDIDVTAPIEERD